MKLDKIDYSILKILQEKGRITNAQLANDVGLSPAPTLERVRKLETSGLIESYHALVNPELLGLGITVFIEVKLNYHSHFKIEQFIETIQSLPEIVESYHITGDGDFLLKMHTQSISDYQKFIVEKLSKIDGVGHIQSKVVLSTIKKEMSLPISDEMMENSKR
ncbi:MAG TPA: Lrp/AsnC family transcriptional regulator [Bacteroidia bacterium]|jgi:Lrp/AsnC family leucine-responsive transcriptional regulator|nr:Lrp/AsnC family transcriptional regulator [Bacteroidia bacterium]